MLGAGMEANGTGNGKRLKAANVLKWVAEGIAREHGPVVKVELDNQTAHDLVVTGARWTLRGGVVHLRLSVGERE